ncbi:hypothetical protein EWM64_g3159 [Hericium alpestre]|uniref:Major facilitator superfamily (MFS) profile domain-containing protein n=1 Tax=Hericium alpestre TaxID=135208 RepID=A0A4Z0A188_9AGAM|nr:hypothetical protein EWM64_g3159 [Hericium alpestre]
MTAPITNDMDIYDEKYVGQDVKLGGKDNFVLEDITNNLAGGEISELVVVAEGEEKTTWFVWLLVLCSSISGLLFGYDTGVISGALVTIGGDLGPADLSSGQKVCSPRDFQIILLNCHIKELITSATTLGALLGGLGAGVLSDRIGRRPVMGIADILFIGGSIGQAVCHTVWNMIGTRFLIGWGVGIAACIAPLYIQELSPTRLRGRMVVINVAAITLGQVIAYGIDAGFESVPHGWRWMVGLGTVPAGLQCIFLFFLPESPRILLQWGRKDEARSVMAKIYARASPEQLELKLLSREVGLIVFLWPVVACGMQAFQQLCGFNTLMYYSATLFKEIGFNKPTAVGLIISGTNFIFTLFALKYIDIIGRRRIMLWSSPGMIFGLTLASISFFYLTKQTNGQLVDGTVYSHKWSSLVLFAMIFYVASYATGIGNVPWQQGELFSLDGKPSPPYLATRSRAHSARHRHVARDAVNWGGNLLIGSTYLSLMDKITPAGAFGFYAGLCLLGFVFVVFCFPETAGLSLEEVQMVFRNGFGIRDSARLRQQKTQARLQGVVKEVA